MDSMMLIAVVALLVAVVLVYNQAKAYMIEIEALLAEIRTAQAKLNRVYAEIGQLLAKYSIHEADLLNAVARGQSNIQFLATKYPQLRADALYQSASHNCEALFSELQQHISNYNSKITAFNTYVTQIPRVLIAAPLGFKEKRHAQINP
jgi:hypothetical protein